MILIQTVLNLEIELINRYIPIAVNFLRRKHVRFSGIYEAGAIHGLEIEVLKEQQPSILSEEEAVYFN